MIDSLKIGPISYRVSEVNDLHYTDDGGKKRALNGHIIHDQAQIKVASDLAEDVKVVCIWHEALHGILSVAGQNDQPEVLMECLSYGLVRLLRDNPELVKLTMQTDSDHIFDAKNYMLHDLGINGDQPNPNLG